MDKSESPDTPGEQSLGRGCTLFLSKHYQVLFIYRIAEKILLSVGSWEGAHFGNTQEHFGIRILPSGEMT